MKEFIKINRDFLTLNDKEISIVRQIGTEGFLLYHYFLYEQASKLNCSLNIRIIQDFLSKDYDNRPLIEYTDKKINKVSTLKDKATIIKHIKTLKRCGYIKLNTDEIKSINQTLIIECTKDLKSIENNPFYLYDDISKQRGFEAFAMQLFVDRIHRIGHIGFTLLCLLGKNFNKNYGSVSCEGFANPTKEYMSKMINRDVKTIRAYLYMLQDEKLIKIKKQPAIQIDVNEYNEPIWQYVPNHYEVNYKLIGNKYNIENEK